jgi:hypothetical protein
LQNKSKFVSVGFKSAEDDGGLCCTFAPSGQACSTFFAKADAPVAVRFGAADSTAVVTVQMAWANLKWVWA